MHIRLTAPADVNRAADALEMALRDLLPDYRIYITDPPYRETEETDEDGETMFRRQEGVLQVTAVQGNWRADMPVSFAMLTDTDTSIAAGAIAGMIDRQMVEREA